MTKKNGIAKGGAALALYLLAGTSVQAQETDLLALGKSDLRREIQTRYDEALTLSGDQTLIAADDARYIWALQAKAQCGIALGFLKSGTKDPVSIGKCDASSRRMHSVPAPTPTPTPVLPVATVQRPDACGEKLAGTIFFEWDSATVPDSAQTNLGSIVEAQRQCGWASLVVIGHTDRSGRDDYNDALSTRRARAVAAVLTAMGIAENQLEVSGAGESALRVPTADGERNPANRRVEVTVK